MSKKIDVVAAMIQKGDQILIAKRVSPPKSWEFPGGKVEEGESKEQALIREIREELSVQIQVGTAYWSIGCFCWDKANCNGLICLLFIGG